MVKVNIPQKTQESSMGRRLFAMAAPIVGGAFGGPAGAAAGSLIGSKLSGASGTESAMNALQAGFSAGKGKEAKAPATDGDPLLQKPELSESAFGRRADQLAQSPEIALNDGLNTLSDLPMGHPLRKELTEPLVRASYLSKRGGF